jgi:hypothetical protein
MSRITAALVALALATPSIAMAGAYLGAGVGGSRFQSTLSDVGLLPSIQTDLTGPDGIGADPDFNSSQVGVQVVAGWMFTENVGAEVGYVDFGSADKEYQLPLACNQLGCQSRLWRAEADLDGIQAFLVGSYPLNKSFDLYGKLGAIVWNADYQAYEPSQRITGGPPIAPQNEPVKTDDDGTDLAAGFGVNLKTDSPFSVRADFTYYAIKDTDAVWTLGLVALYTFE